MKLDRRFFIHHNIAAIPVETLACRTDAVFRIIAHRKVSCRVGGGCPVSGSILFLEALFVPVSFCKAGITFSELGIRDIGIDAPLP